MLNANFNAPYFHDGRYDTYDQVVDHFNSKFKLGLSSQDHADLVAYLQAIGGGLQPYDRDFAAGQIKEINDLASVLATAIPAHDNDVIVLTVDTVSRELRDLVEQYPGVKDTTVEGGLDERLTARKELKNLVLTMRRIGLAASNGRFDEAAAEYRNYRNLSFAKVPITLSIALPWSLFNPIVHKAHFGELRQLLQSAQKLPQH